MKQTIFGFHPKRNIANRTNKLIKFLYGFSLKLSFDTRFSTKDKFALLDFDKKLREITQELFQKWDHDQCVVCGDSIKKGDGICDKCGKSYT